MELVLSPGRIGGENNTGSPFHNQEVREWSHVDRLTGMLEHARIETGRWEARHQGTAQAYGKVIDSRERNSADGNVVQKARRQVEVFQSQGIGGRSVQVVRASQWSSSRITDSSSSSPVSVSMNDVSQLRNGNEDKSVNAILSGPDESMTKLSQVSRLCRQINGDTIQKNRLSESPVFGNRFKSKFEGYNAVSKEERNKLNSSSLIMNSLKSTSNEDLTKSVYNDPKTKSQTIFTRDCKARRSLQIPKSVVSEDFDRSRNDEMIRVNPEGMEYVEKNNSSRNSPSNSDHDISVLKNERKRVKSYVLGMENADSESVIPLSLPKPIINKKKILFNGTAVGETGKEIVKSEYLRPTPILLKPKSNTTVVHLNNKLFIESAKNPIAENDTVKNLIENEATAAVRSISTSTKSRVQSLANRFSNGGNNFMSINGKIESITSQNIFSQNTATFFGKKQTIVDSSSRIEGLINRSAVLNGTDNSVDIFPALMERKTITDDPSIGTALQGKPVKKVGFCKTEVHFAAESGKVNIVETDCKPPPSNRFRRRRRNSVVTNMPISAQNKNLPLIHFGDTSYEKYIFGQSNGQFKTDDFNGAKEKQDSENQSETDSTASIKDKTASGPAEQRLTTSSDELNLRDGWRARLKTIIKSEPPTMQITVDDDCNDDVINLGKNFDVIDETIVDHSFKGSLHTTTVNLGANVISKIQKQKHTNEGKCNTISTGIQLQFNTRVEKVTPGITSGTEIKPCIAAEVEKTDKTAVEATVKSSPAVVSTEKNHPQYSIVVSTISKIPRPLIQTQQSVLKSAHLVMNINKIRDISSIVKKTTDSITLSADNKFTNKYENNDKNNSLNLKHLISSLHENCSSTHSAPGMIFRERDSSADVDMVNNNYPRNNTSTLITVNANNNTMNKKNQIITNGNTCQTSRFTPLRLKNFNDRLNNCEDDRRGNIVTIEDRNTCRDNNQLQYSSGSEQADEEVRSYMLGSKIHRSSYKVQNKKFTHSARSVIETEERCRRTGSFDKSNEEHSSSTTVKENWDNDDLIDNIVKNETTIDDELDNIISSDLPAEEEVFFEANGTVEKNHILTGEMMNENNVVTSDNENNKVLMNIVTTHEPVIARVEDSHSSPVDTMRDHQLILSGKKLRSNSVTELLSISEKNDKILRENQINRGSKTASASSGKKSIVKPPVLQPKSSKDDDNCDNKISGKELSTRIISNDDSAKTIADPTYVNVFENAKKKKSVPIYENYRVIRNKNNSNDKKFSKKVITRSEMNAVTDREVQAKSATNGNPDVEVISSLPVADNCEEEIYKQYNKSREPDGKLATISESNTSKRNNNREVHKMIKPAKTRSKKIVRPPSSTSSIDSVHRNSANENPKDFEDSKPLHAKSTRSSRLHRVTSTSHESSGQENGERYTSNDSKKTTSERTSNGKLNRSNQVVLDNTNCTATTKNDQVSKNFNDNARSKKPIEIVYQTAVFNMKNEKLAKSSRSKESKTPRYINDLICGSKPRRSTDARHVKGTAASLSQQRTYHKSTSPTNRHWK